ncbi:MAG: 3-hydroxyacyl-CoA dehydrogenase family protein, partial [Cocleimonas sp.]
DIATWCAMQGLQVTIQDTSTEALGRVVGRANDAFKRRYRKDKLRIRNAQDNLIPDLHGHGIAKADVIIEAIFEDLEAKRTLFKDIEKRARVGAILATNTSSIVLSDIATVMEQPDRLVGLHFFNPVIKMPLVEVIYTPEQTEPDVIRLAQCFSAHINKLPLAVKSSPGFLINRILMPYILEGVIANQEGIPVSVIDKACTDFGMPMGPLELADTVGLDICLHVGEIVADTVGVTIPDALNKSIQSGNLGKKTGQGFYQWKKSKKLEATKGNAKEPWNGDPQALQDRLIGKLLHESQRCLDEGLVEDADLLDAGVIFGTGFAPFLGGPLHTSQV